MSDDPLDQLPCGFIRFAHDGSVTRVNAALRSSLEWTDAALTGRTFAGCLSIASRIFFETHLLPLLRLQGSAQEVSLTFLDGKRRPVPSLVNVVRRDVDGQVWFDCAVMVYRERHRFEADLVAARDAAERALTENAELVAAKGELESYAHQLDRQLTRSAQHVTEIARINQVLAHDLGEPARKLQVLTDYLAQENAAALPPRGQRHVARIQQESARIQELLGHLQRFLAMEPAAESAAPVDLPGMLNDVSREIAEHERGHRLTWAATALLPAIDAYPEELRTAFHHLLQALAHSDDAGLVHVDIGLLRENVFKALPGRYRYDDAVRLVFTVKSVRFDATQMQLFLTSGAKVPREWEPIAFGLAHSRKLIVLHRGSLVLEPADGGPADLAIRIVVHLPVKQ